jgi:hypothetical protein
MLNPLRFCKTAVFFVSQKRFEASFGTFGKQKIPAENSKDLSGWQDSNLRPPAPKAGAITGLRYTPKAAAKITLFSAYPNDSMENKNNLATPHRSPNGSGKPAAAKSHFYRCERATAGSSFGGAVKNAFGTAACSGQLEHAAKIIYKQSVLRCV